MPEVFLDYEISDPEEIDDEESEDKQIYLNSMSPWYKSAKHDSYTDFVYQYKVHLLAVWTVFYVEKFRLTKKNRNYSVRIELKMI